MATKIYIKLSRYIYYNIFIHTFVLYKNGKRYKGHSINFNIFTSVQTIHFRGGVGGCENQHFYHTLLTFWPDFYYFLVDLWHSKNVDVYAFGGRGSQKVYGLYTRENVDIYGQALR